MTSICIANQMTSGASGKSPKSNRGNQAPHTGIFLEKTRSPITANQAIRALRTPTPSYTSQSQVQKGLDAAAKLRGNYQPNHNDDEDTPAKHQMTILQLCPRGNTGLEKKRVVTFPVVIWTAAVRAASKLEDAVVVRRDAADVWKDAAVAWKDAAVVDAARTRRTRRNILAPAGRDLSARDRSFMRAILHHDYTVRSERIFNEEIRFMRANPTAEFYLSFDYSTGNPTVEIKCASDNPGYVKELWDDYFSRARACTGQMELHLIVAGKGRKSWSTMIPMRSDDARIHEELKRVASSMEVISDNPRTASLIREREKSVVYIH
ncbi:hypothetical protein B0H11DRAFT_1929488 [Mycena galericulata]|nr:hypothetical protein B0H11DRAFT_1929488 [Mycena galericulata]